jgi:hypothetical protein
MSMKLLGSLQADLSVLYDFSGQAQTDGNAYRGLVDGSNEDSNMLHASRTPSVASAMGGHADSFINVSKGLLSQNNNSPRNVGTPFIGSGVMSDMNSSFHASGSKANAPDERIFNERTSPVTPGKSDYYSVVTSDGRDNMSLKGLKSSAEKYATLKALNGLNDDVTASLPEKLQDHHTSLHGNTSGGLVSATKLGNSMMSPSGVDKSYISPNQKQQFMSPVQSMDDHDDTHFLSVRPMRYEASSALGRFNDSVEKRVGSPDATAIGSDIHAFNDNKQDLMSVANEVSKLLASMNVPPVFPSPKTILEITSQLATDNQYNHNLIAELLKLDSLSTADSKESAKVNEGSLQQSWSPTFASPVTPKPKSKIMTFPDVPADSDAIDAMQTQSSIGRRSSTRGSISLDITPKMPLFVQQLSSFSPTTTESNQFTAPASTVSFSTRTLDISQSDLSHCSEVVFYFREDPAFLLAALKNMDKLQAIGFIRIIVDRVLSPWSCDDEYFGAIIEQLAIHDTVAYKNKTNNQSSSFSLVKVLMSCIWGRYDVVEYLKYLCNAVELDGVIGSLTLESIADSIVEPICRRFEASVATHSLPHALLQMLSAVSKVGDNTSLANILSEEMTPYFAKWLGNKICSITKKSLDAKQRGFISKLSDLFNMSCGKQLTKPLKLSISETSCITRCKWLLDKVPTHSPTHSLTYSLTYSLTHLGV